jgi:hypothetical protein
VSVARAFMVPDGSEPPPAETAPYPPAAERSGDPSAAGAVMSAFGASGGSGGGAGSGGGSGSGGLPTGLGGPTGILGILAQAMPTLVVTTSGVTMMMAFMVFGKRRRDGMPTAPDDVLAANAALGSGYVPTSGLGPDAVRPNAVAAATAVKAATVDALAPIGEDAHLPRWRRPSLMEARKTDPLRAASANVHLTFEGDVRSAVTGMERRVIRYRLVSLLSAPDEVRGVEIGVLDEGDEVVLLEKRGTYWRVLCPNGTEGWLHKMTLGDVVIDASTTPGNTWTAGDEVPLVGGFEDVLRAYTERRQQFGDA